jgi:hypothetical protein
MVQLEASVVPGPKKSGTSVMDAFEFVRVVELKLMASMLKEAGGLGWKSGIEGMVSPFVGTVTLESTVTVGLIAVLRGRRKTRLGALCRETSDFFFCLGFAGFHRRVLSKGSSPSGRSMKRAVAANRNPSGTT